MTGEEFLSHPMNQEQSVAQALSLGWPGRVGNTAVPKWSASSSQLGLISGSYQQALVTPDLRLSGTTTAGTPP